MLILFQQWVKDENFYIICINYNILFYMQFIILMNPYITQYHNTHCHITCLHWYTLLNHCRSPIVSI